MVVLSEFSMLAVRTQAMETTGSLLNFNLLLDAVREASGFILLAPCAVCAEICYGDGEDVSWHGGEVISVSV